MDGTDLVIRLFPPTCCAASTSHPTPSSPLPPLNLFINFDTTPVCPSIVLLSVLVVGYPSVKGVVCPNTLFGALIANNRPLPSPTFYPNPFHISTFSPPPVLCLITIDPMWTTQTTMARATIMCPLFCHKRCRSPPPILQMRVSALLLLPSILATMIIFKMLYLFLC